MEKERDESIIKAEKQSIALDEQSRRIAYLEDIVKRQDDEILHLRDMSKLLTAKVIPALPIITGYSATKEAKMEILVIQIVVLEVTLWLTRGATREL